MHNQNTGGVSIRECLLRKAASGVEDAQQGGYVFKQSGKQAWLAAHDIGITSRSFDSSHMGIDTDTRRVIYEGI